jgi:hypothetical protein
MSLQEKYLQFCRSDSCYPDEKKMRKLEELDTYDYIFFLTHILGMTRVEAFDIGQDYKLYRSECGSLGFSRESAAAAFIYHFQKISTKFPVSQYVTNVERFGASKDKICEEAHVSISSFDRMLRKIERDISKNEYLCRVFCRIFYVRYGQIEL